jgi:hypothetical protein
MPLDNPETLLYVPTIFDRDWKKVKQQLKHAPWQKKKRKRSRKKE